MLVNIKVKGVYALIVKLEKDIKVNIGALGKINFKKGDYAYIGSAQNNLQRRIDRHLRDKKRKHWHIDYLLKNKKAKVTEVYYKTAGKEEECRIAKLLEKNETPVKRFGCSDCKCASHLFKLENKKTIRKEMIKYENSSNRR